MKCEKEIYFREDEKGQKFPFLDFGSETHGRISFRLWVSGKLLKQNKEGKYVIEFPVKAKIEKTEKGSLVLKPSDSHLTHNVFVRCGYRGESSFEVLAPQGFTLFSYKVYHSPRGNLGVSEGALITIPNGEILKYKWNRTGRTYGSPSSGITVVMPDGEERNFEELPDGLEALQELPKMEE